MSHMVKPIEDLLPLYALDELSEAEKAEVEAYLEAHPEKRAEVEALRVAHAAAEPPADVPATLPQPDTDEVDMAASTRVEQSSFFQRFFKQKSFAVFGLSRAVVVGLVVIFIAGWSIFLLWQIIQVRADNSALQQQVAAQQKLLTGLNVRLEPLEQNAALLRELAGQEGQPTSLQDLISPLQTENAALKEAITLQQQQIQALSSQLAAFQAQNAPIEQTVAAQAQTLAVLNAQFEPLRRLNLTVSRQIIAQGDQLTALNTSLSQLQEVNQRLTNELTLQRAALVQVASPDTRIIAMQGSEAYAGARGQLIANPSSNSGVLLVNGLPLLEPNQVYQLWFAQGNQFVAAGVFTVDEAGFGLLAINAEAAIGSYNGLGISVEPAGGSQSPTGQMVMIGSLS